MKDLLHRITVSTDEYIESGGRVSCDISISRRQKENTLLLKMLSRINEKLRNIGLFEEDSKTPQWSIEHCSTCKKHTKGKSPFHLELTWKDLP